MGVDLTEVARQVQDIPGFIARKFDEQREAIAATQKTRWDRIMQISTLAAAIAAVLASLVAHLTPGVVWK